MPARKPTSHDVARLAGVSQTTVSYVMSGRRSVAPETERRVLDAMTELGYQPNSGARALRSNRSNLIAIAVPYHAGADPAAQHRFIVSLAARARAHDYDLLLVTADEGTAGLRRVIDTALCDGLLIMEVTQDDPRTAVVCQSNTPAVFIGLPGNDDPVIAVDSDYSFAAREAVNALTHTGHKRITFLRPGDSSLTDLNFLVRFANAVHEQAELHGIDLVEHTVDVSYRHIMDSLKTLSPDIGDSLLLAPLVPVDDWCNALRSRGLIPGQDVSVIASSWDKVRSHSIDQPTHFDMRPEALTARAIDLLLERLDSPAPQEPSYHLIAPAFHEGTTLRQPD
ncbi:LacI family DNA-binding transcriptional regulator [Schaalia vaccimaxillae]|uniref:LacI family DNA-binding transcriptional regulator n=1 Tax=Schaalia vaccimaxillae TaxID=183916 RepID=UPI0003B44D1D|nr:LacI family DNA-binding transcriptional regulator [Schaalia vaccimaxillae]